jgi:hypothetical protein
MIPTGVDADAPNRDVHGHLLNNDDPAFTVEALMEGRSKRSDACRSLAKYGPYTSTTLEHELLCSPLTCAWKNSIVEEYDECPFCRDNFLPGTCLLKDATVEEKEEYELKEGPECQRKCQLEKSDGYYNAITRGIELVFGDKPSVGFICSVKEAVIIYGKDLPGYCCLDAPYQLNISNWGNAVSVEIESDSQRSKYDD